MISWPHIYIVAFIATSVLALIYTPICMKFAEKTDFMDRPSAEAHKKHARAIPLLGGVAILGAWLTAIILGYLFIISVQTEGIAPELAQNREGISYVSGRVMIICLGAILATGLGLCDDKFSLRPATKFLGQAAIAAIVVTWGGFRISIFFNNPLIIWCISVFWFLLIFNAINFFDNMDGLAIGTATIALLLFSSVAAINGQHFIAVLGMLSAGATAGFWFFNHTPACIFMGDSGSHLIGYMLAIVSAGTTYFSHNASPTRFPILIPFFILAVPLFDTLAVIVIRLRDHKPIYVGDHNHISHRFVRMGLSRKRAVQAVHLMALIVGLSVLPLLWGDEKTALVIVSQALLMMVLITLLQYAATPEADDEIEAAVETPEETEEEAI
jgi:UDP-GlcNAc:undecaprenyl-phosphate/decaprenyl-phosphate GlcNAc-1-phosphate transferase